MSQIPSFAELSPDEAAGLLAKKAAVVALVKKAGFEKRALGTAGVMGTGALLGGALGGAGGYFLGDQPDEEGKRHPWRDALTGAISGGAVGPLEIFNPTLMPTGAMM